jgi:hypothetical protein
MAITAMEKYTITFIQSVWRGHLGRQEFKRHKATRFLWTYLSFRYRWRRDSRASYSIVVAYRKHYLLKKLKLFVFPSQTIRIIQKAYKKRFLRIKAIIRCKAQEIWNHVKLFGICKAKHVLCPYEKARLRVLNLFMRFHRKIRARRYVNIVVLYETYFHNCDV